jgi:hypothetical protein
MASTCETHNSNQLIEKQLDIRSNDVEKSFSADVISYLGPIIRPTDDLLKDTIEGIKARRKHLIIILETDGGYAEVAQRMADTFRFHYELVDFIIPNYAMSAGTILAMSGDSIYMDYYSVLGPIDPQIQNPNGKGLIPALGYLIQYDKFLKKAETGKLNTAEMAFFINKFNPAELYRYEQERELSVKLLKEWLVKYKFKNWSETETRKIPVTPAMKTKAAEEIARKLNDTDRWHSHGIGISMETLRKDLNLKIEDFQKNPKVNTQIKYYYKLLKDYMMRRDHKIVIHTKKEYIGFE